MLLLGFIDISENKLHLCLLVQLNAQYRTHVNSTEISPKCDSKDIWA